MKVTKMSIEKLPWRCTYSLDSNNISYEFSVCIMLHTIHTYPFILDHMFIYYSVFSLCFNACSRATPVIPSCSAKSSFLQSQSCGIGPLQRILCLGTLLCICSLIFNSLVVAGAPMHAEFCVAALFFTPG